MRILDFKHGDKIRRQSWPKGSFILITTTAYERFGFELWGGALLVIEMLAYTQMKSLRTIG